MAATPTSYTNESNFYLDAQTTTKETLVDDVFAGQGTYAGQSIDVKHRTVYTNESRFIDETIEEG